MCALADAISCPTSNSSSWISSQIVARAMLPIASTHTHSHTHTLPRPGARHEAHDGVPRLEALDAARLSKGSARTKFKSVEEEEEEEEEEEDLFVFNDTSGRRKTQRLSMVDCPCTYSGSYVYFGLT